MPVRPVTLRRLFSVAAVATVALLAGRGSASPTPTATTVSSANAVAQRYYPEVRLRKLHLVRPDLIPFPIDFDVYC